MNNMSIHIPYWLASAIFGFVFCSFLYAVIRKATMWIFDIIQKNQEIASEDRLGKMADSAIAQIREKHGIQKEA